MICQPGHSVDRKDHAPTDARRWAMKLWRDYLNTENETFGPAAADMNE